MGTITCKTFTKSRGTTVKGMQQAQDEAGKETEAFIANQLRADDVVAITESALPSTWGHCLVSVTVWYRAR